MTTSPGGIEPDTKDWTWVLERSCPECGLDASSVAALELPGRLRANARSWQALLGDPDVGARSRPDRWSALEYACHVADVHRVFHGRVSAMLAADTPTFANWDQDETAAVGRYGERVPAEVATQLLEAAYAVADLYASVPDDGWPRRGVRSNGSEFTIESLGRYHLHDVVHHLHDVEPASGGPR